MSTVTTPTHMIDQEVITHTDVNQVFLDLKNNTDGTTSNIDDENFRSGAIDREHLADAVFLKGAASTASAANPTADLFTANSTDTGVPIVATTVRENTSLASITLKQGEVLRYGADALFRGGPQNASTNFANALARVEQQVYLSVHFYMSPTNGATDYWLSTKNFGFSITNGPYSNQIVSDYSSIGWSNVPNVVNVYLRQNISGALIFPNAQEANIEKVVLKCHVENSDNFAYIANNKVWAMVQTN